MSHRHELRMMKALTQRRYGGIDTLEYETAARPEAVLDDSFTEYTVAQAKRLAHKPSRMSVEKLICRWAVSVRRRCCDDQA